MSKAFGPLVALDDASIRVKAGSFHALLGENGAGKSTLVKCIMGFHRPDRLQGPCRRKRTRDRESRHGSSGAHRTAYEHSSLVPSLTAARTSCSLAATRRPLFTGAEERARLVDFLA